MQERTLRKLAQVENAGVRGRFMEQAGIKSATTSQFLAREFKADGEGYKGFREADKDRQSGKTAETWRDKMLKLAKASASPTDPVANATLQIRDTVQKIEAFLKTSIYVALGLIVARIAFASLRSVRGGTGWTGLKRAPVTGAPPPAAGPIAPRPPPTAPGMAPIAGATPVATKAGRFARAGTAMKGAGRRVGGFVRGAGGKMLGAAGAGLTLAHGLYAGITKKGGTSEKIQAGGEAILGDITMGLYPMAEKAVYGHLSVELQRKMGKDQSFARMIAESKTGSKIIGGLMGTGGRSDKQQEILNDIDRRRVTRRAAISKEEAKQYYNYKALLRKADKAKHLLSDEEKKQLEIAKKHTMVMKRLMKLREEGFKQSREETTEAQYTETGAAIGKLTKGEFSHIKDKKKRTQAIMQEVVRRSGRLTLTGGTEALTRMTEGKGGGTLASNIAAAKYQAKLKELGGDAEYAKTLAPQMIEKFKIMKTIGGAGSTKKMMLSGTK